MATLKSYPPKRKSRAYEDYPNRRTNPDGSWKVCKAENCELPVRCRGLCRTHYEWELRSLPLGDARTHGKRCPVRDCKVACLHPADMCGKHTRQAKGYNLSWIEFVKIKNGTQVCQNWGCENTERLHIDHNHNTGEIRGLLCHGCNVALGMIQENPRRLQGLLDWIHAPALMD